VTHDASRAKLLFQGGVVLAGAAVATVPENPTGLVSGDELANDVSSHPLAKSESPSARRDVAFQGGEGVVKPPLCCPAQGPHSGRNFIVNVHNDEGFASAKRGV
jgi:hypothetical protein